MPIDSVASFIRALCDHGLLEADQLDELSAPAEDLFPVPQALARELVRRGWLTPYQAVQVFEGRAQDLSLGPYLLLQHLGQGGMARVFKARHRLMNRTVALKILRKGGLAPAEAIHRFHCEIQAAAQVTHPNIVLAHDAACIGDTYFLVMEYVEGIDLAKLVKEHGPLPVGQACDYVRQAALGLQHAFERGLVHRDIKPSNLLLTFQGSVIKILDMGIASLDSMPPAPAGSASPRSPMLLGTPDYIAPEQAVDPGRADIRADIYSLGCTLYYLLAGQPPFAAGTQAEKLLGHQQVEPPAVEQLRPELPADLLPVIRKMMSKQLPDRYATPADVARALEPFAQAGSCDAHFLLTLGDEGLGSLDPAQPTLAEAHPAPAPAADGGGVGLSRPQVAGRGWRLAVCLAGALLLAGVALFFLSPPRPTLLHHQGIVRTITWSPDGKLLATGGGDNLIRIWDAATLTQRAVLRGHSDSVYSVAFAPDGSTLLSGSADNTLRLWQVDSGEQLRLFEGHRWFVLSVAFSPDGRHALSGSSDKTVRLWDVRTGRQLHCFEGHTDPVIAVAFCPDGRRVLSGSQDTTLRLWDLAAGRQLRRFDGHTDAVWSVAVSPDGRRAVSGSGDGTVRLWNVESGKEINRLEGHTAVVYSVAYSSDGRQILSGSADKTVRLWDADSGQQLRCFRGHTDAIRAVAASPDGRSGASGGGDETVRLWSLRE
ncbi:MAG TPA: serine/threonine-protein kinase [Gemmataceae bacterium]|jgi:tRNA A-37 threonylcarbamoyl transferase component Bud32|nr:serine/threonine-protein kinase [Gemmataceae bacterium]